MSTFDTHDADPDPSAHASLQLPDGIEIRTLSSAADMEGVVGVFQQIWGSVTELVRLEMLMAIAHSGGYVSAAYDVTGGSEWIVGASVALLARHQDRPALHSHITGILPGVRSSGLGRAMKLHQHQWAHDRDIDWIVWTFDPLVRRNAWFNIAVLGADVHDYLHRFYGTMTDAVNTGDDSDRLLVAWNVATTPTTLRDGSDLDGSAERVSTPEDIVALRRTDPVAVRRWREATRESLSTALAAGRPIVGFTRDGDYLIGAAT